MAQGERVNGSSSSISFKSQLHGVVLFELGLNGECNRQCKA